MTHISSVLGGDYSRILKCGMELNTPLTNLKGVGPEVTKKLKTLGLQTISDLIEDFPRRYDDYSHITRIHSIRPGTVTIRAAVKQAKGRYSRRGLHVTEAVASDDTGSVRLVWFNQPYRLNNIKPNTDYFISGEYAFKNQGLSITNPSMELVSDFPLNTARIVPIYRETKGLKSVQLRKLLRLAVPVIRSLKETLPEWVVREADLTSAAEAYEAMHFPLSTEQLDAAKRRLGFEEVFSLTLSALLNKRDIAHEAAVSIPFNEVVAKDFVRYLPFTLTDAQRKAVWSIYQDMQKHQPMNRLIEGDVGSGKTVVAAMAALMALHHGFQVALMAPTELLARQHAETIIELLTPMGLQHTVCLLIGGLSRTQKSAAHAAIAEGNARFVIGTHALIQDKVDMRKLGLVIVDEQHRFGVDQRKKLQAKAGHAVHVLSTTATPIPRSLALTLYGELDISIIDTKPAGRKPIITTIVPAGSRQQMEREVQQQLVAGRQVFCVCPLIVESDVAVGKSVEEVCMTMQKTFPQHKVGMLHGKLKSAEKDAIMQEFLAHHIDILVSTTVIEVGVHIPNATVMLVENADRFGLAQIHQLRGRVGRSEHQGYCYLVTTDNAEPTKRLRALQTSNDGFRLAEFDLRLRGPGAIYGTSQHGALDLRVARLTDVELISLARKLATKFLDSGEDLIHYQQLYERVKRLRAVTNLN